MIGDYHLSDSKTGPYYYRARYYNANAGRFINEDPVGFGGGMNFYAYVSNSPIDWIDPTGLLAELICEPISPLRGGWKNAFPLLLAHPRHCYIHIQCPGFYDVTVELYGPQPEDPKHGAPHINPYNPKRGGIRTPITGPSGAKCCQLENNILKN